MNHWRRDREFCRLLRETARHLTRDKLKRLSSIAVEDHRCCYKLMLAMINREARGADTGERLNLFYVLSDVLLTTHRKCGAQNRLTARLQAEPELFLKYFNSCPLSKRLKVLGWWAKCNLFFPERFRRVRMILLEDSHNAKHSLPSAESAEFERRLKKNDRIKIEECCSSPMPKRRKHYHEERVPVVLDRDHPLLFHSQRYSEVCSPGKESTSFFPHSLSETTKHDSSLVVHKEQLEDRQAKSSCVVGPFGIPYHETWGFGEGRDGREAMLHLGRKEDSLSKIDWFKICARIANIESTAS